MQKVLSGQYVSVLAQALVWCVPLNLVGESFRDTFILLMMLGMSSKQSTRICKLLAPDGFFVAIAAQFANEPWKRTRSALQCKGKSSRWIWWATAVQWRGAETVTLFLGIPPMNLHSGLGAGKHFDASVVCVTVVARRALYRHQWCNQPSGTCSKFRSSSREKQC
jgi:hypothetical protein